MSGHEPYEIKIRDPVHGTLKLSRNEIAVVDHPAYQRLRSIKQLGLADLAFPGATHSRYSHGLGTMHVATSMWRAIQKELSLKPEEKNRFHQTLRLAALFHDLGHAPLSHTTEAFMPPVRELSLGRWLVGEDHRQATHEDYALKLITDSSLTALIEEQFRDHGVTPDDIATLIAGQAPKHTSKNPFVVDGRDYMPLLRQCVSSELDADRMDYLLRDSYFAGVPYGRYDLEWILENLTPVEHQDRVFLGLSARASFAFEDFLLSRYHMFMSVYFHHVSIGYEAMLARLHQENAHNIAVPAEVEGYLKFDDIFFFGVLRELKSPWARRIVERDAYRMLLELKEVVPGPEPEQKHGLQTADNSEKERSIRFQTILEELNDKGVSAQAHTVKGQLSKYFSAGSQRPENTVEDLPLFIVEEGRVLPIETYSPLYKRYSGEIHLRRIYVDPTQHAKARAIVQNNAPPP